MTQSAVSAPYEVLRLCVEASDEDRVAAELWQWGTLGIEASEAGASVVLTAYFESGRLEAESWPAGPRRWAGVDLEVVGFEVLEAQDWLERYRLEARPFGVGARFWVDPREPGALPVGEAPEGRIRLSLPARRAFGTGSHESTRLAVELLERCEPDGKTLLDVGSGSGILGFVALSLGASRVVGLEVDPAAALVARENQVLNRLPFELYAGRVAALSEAAAFDLAVVNVIPSYVEAEVPAIVRRLRPAGHAVFSGFLVEQAEPYRRTLERCGLAVRDSAVDGDWQAFLMERA